MKQYPEPIVGAFIINPDGNLFLMKSHKWSNKYVVPGGHIEIGEKIEDALEREVKEETGLDIYDPKFICLWEFISENEYFKKSHMIFLNYLVKAGSNDAMLSEESQEYVWVTPKDALTLSLEKYTKLTIEKYILN